jgi:RNA polymerase sigma factor (sigma-70 family)
MEDMQLLRQYAETGCQDAFERLVTRHIDWIYSVCLRGVKDRHLAEDVTQAVFIILARKSKSLAPNTVLRGWLFKAARFAVADALKKQNRHKRHVQRAAALGATDLSPQEAATWDRVAPALEEAIACLNEKDRQAIMLRFYESKSLAEVGTILGISEEAAKKRVSRAVEKLRAMLTREGVAVSAALLLLLLTSRASQAAPLTLKLSASSAATGSSVASGMASAIARGASRQMLHAAARLLAALAASALLLLVGLMLMASLVQQRAQRQVTRVVRASPPRPIATLIDSTTLDRFEHIWVGARDKVLWQFHRSDDGSNHDVPEIVHDDLNVAKLYAVAVDREGVTWVKRLNRELLTAPESADPILAKPGAALPITCTDDVLALLLTDHFKSALSGRSNQTNFQSGPLTPAERKQILQPTALDSPPPSGDGLGDHQWHPLTPDLPDGALAEDLPPMIFETFQLENLLDPGFRDPGSVLVPEPTTLCTLLVAMALLARRRRGNP